jgi:hypothetical protein
MKNCHVPHHLVLLILMIGPVTLKAEDKLVTSYATVISKNDTRNSKGAILDEVAGILMQDRANAHKFGNPDGDFVDNYFTTAERRAEIPGMLKLGDFPEQLSDPIRKGDGAVIRVAVYRNSDGRFYMSVGARIRDQANYDPSLMNDPEVKTNGKEALLAPEGNSRAAPVRELEQDDAERQRILNVLRLKVSIQIGEPVEFKGSVRVLGSWAKMTGNVFTKSGNEPKEEEAKSLIELDYAALLRKEDGDWKVLHDGFASDVGLEIEMRTKFPDVPLELVPRIPE